MQDKIPLLINQNAYTIQNEAQFPYLSNLRFFSLNKDKAIKSKSFNQVLTNFNVLMTKLINLQKNQYVLLEIDEKTKKIKLYEKHQNITHTNSISQRKLNSVLTFHGINKYNHKFSLNLKKNFVNGSMSPGLAYHILSYNDDINTLKLKNKSTIGLKWDIKKYLSPTLYSNQKHICVSNERYQPFANLAIKNIKTGIFIQNRQNFSTTQTPIYRNSDVIGYNLSTSNQKIGLQLKFKGGLDWFNKSYYQQITFDWGNFKEFQKCVLQMVCRGGIVLGKNIAQNDLLTRSNNKWVQDRSKHYLNPRVNLIFKNFHTIFGGVFQLVPYFYLQGWISKNSKQIKTKYELDYGFGLRFINLGLSLDANLIKLGKNIDDINPSIRINF